MVIFRLLKQHFWGIALIIAIAVGSSAAVRIWKARHPGAMTVVEAQAMDMTAMKPPTGAVPVATEIVRRASFAAKVTYTGSVAPYTEQNIYPRVEGWLRDLRAYNGDRVPAGKLLAVIASPDLETRVAEAAAGRAAATAEITVAQSGAARMAAERAAARGDVQAAKSDLAGAKARVAAARRGVTQAEEEFNAGRASLAYWQAEIRREENLLKAGAVSLQEYQSEKAQAAAAEAEVGNRKARVEEARANVAAAQAEVASKQAMVGVANQKAAAAEAAVTSANREIAQKTAAANQAKAIVATAATIDSYRYIRAPFAGLVTKRYISPGQFVTPTDAILNIVQIDKVRLQANVADKDIPRIQLGAPVLARLAKDPTRTYSTRVTSISPMAEQASRTAVVEALLDNPGYKLVPGDFVTMEIATSRASDQLTVPTSAIVSKAGRDAVWIVVSEAPKGKITYYCTMDPQVTSSKPGNCRICGMPLVPKTSGGTKKARLVYVTLGASDGERTEALSGLSEGDEVIYRGNTYLQEGDVVFPTAWSEEGPVELPKAPGMEHGPAKTGAPTNMENMPGMEHEGPPR